MRVQFAIAMLVAAAGSPVMAGLTDTRVDTTPGSATVDGLLSANEYGPGNSYSYAGAGTGFGGTVGNGALYLNSDASTLHIGFQPGGGLDNNMFMMIDSRSGGFLDAQMRDRGDGGRRAVSELSLETDDAFPAGFLPDFGLVVGSFGIVLFELNAGNTDFHLPFVSFDGTFSGNAPTFREYAIPLATLGSGAGLNIDFFLGYASDSSYLSNESIPANPALQANGNPGFGDGQFGGTVGSPGFENFDRFTTVPAPGAVVLFGAAGLLAARRRRA